MSIIMHYFDTAIFTSFAFVITFRNMIIGTHRQLLLYMRIFSIDRLTGQGRTYARPMLKSLDSNKDYYDTPGRPIKVLNGYPNTL